MRSSRKIAATALAGTLLATVLATGASADTVEATFTVTNNGGLAVTAAGSTAALGTVDTAAATAVTGTLPKLTVSDTRNPLLGGWSVSVAATSFSNGATTPHVIAGADVSYWSGTATVDSGVVVVAGQQTQATPVDLSATRNAVVATGASGNNSASFTPSISVSVTGAPVGTYSGSIVHSVTGS